MVSSVSSLENKLSSHVQVVLVQTSHPGNIGAVARAMKNMGLVNLCLVSPKDFPSDEAHARSSGADDLLANATVVTDLDAAIANSRLVIGASARSRKMVWPLVNPRDCASLVLSTLSGQSEASSDGPVISLLFGREASGLTNDELQRCHYHVNIPANPDYASLNLAMAVQVISYELRMAVLGVEELGVGEVGVTGQSDESVELDITAVRPNDLVSSILSPDNEVWDGDLASVEDVEGFLTHLESTLIKIGYHDPENPRQLMSRLRRLFQRAHMDKMEVNIMRGILKDVLKSVSQ